MRREILTIPTVLGPVVLAYNLPGFDGELTLSGPVIADIYLGRITRWNDPALQALNPEAELPDVVIHPAMRADGSGTTNIFTGYLSAVSPTWRREIGSGTTVFWPTGTEWSGEGNDGVAQRILILPGGLGYLEMRYAQNAGLRYAALVNRAGVAVRPSVMGVQAAEANTPAAPGAIIKPSMVDAPGRESYPIAGFTYLLVFQNLGYLDDAAKAEALVMFLRWALTDGQSHASALGYTPLPEDTRLGALRWVNGIVLPTRAAAA
jgi:phosphate transport system substrate-binding protein